MRSDIILQQILDSLLSKGSISYETFTLTLPKESQEFHCHEPISDEDRKELYDRHKKFVIETIGVLQNKIDQCLSSIPRDCYDNLNKLKEIKEGMDNYERKSLNDLITWLGKNKWCNHDIDYF